MTRPSPANGVFDWLAGPVLDTAQNRYSPGSFVLRDKLGGGNFGVTYEGVQVDVSGTACGRAMPHVWPWRTCRGGSGSSQAPAASAAFRHATRFHQGHCHAVGAAGRPCRCRTTCEDILPTLATRHACTQPKEQRTSISQRGQLTPEQKKRRVVLKRVNQDKSLIRCAPAGLHAQPAAQERKEPTALGAYTLWGAHWWRRGDFLQKGGTMAKGAGESGRVESYMNAKVKRNPIVSQSCAQYLGYFIAGAQLLTGTRSLCFGQRARPPARSAVAVGPQQGRPPGAVGRRSVATS